VISRLKLIATTKFLLEVAGPIIAEISRACCGGGMAHASLSNKDSHDYCVTIVGVVFKSKNGGPGWK
jgi:hypothetical protein